MSGLAIRALLGRPVRSGGRSNTSAGRAGRIPKGIPMSDEGLQHLAETRIRLLKTLRTIYSASSGLLNELPGWESAVEELPNCLREYRAALKPYVAVIRKNTSGTISCLGMSSLTAHELLIEVSEHAIFLLSTSGVAEPGMLDDLLHDRSKYFDLVTFNVGERWQQVKEVLTWFRDDAGDWGRLKAHLEREADDLTTPTKTTDGRAPSEEERREEAQGGDNSPQMKRAEPANSSPLTFTPKEIQRELGCSDKTLNAYAKKAGVATPTKRGHRYTDAERMRILFYVATGGTSESTIAANAKRLLAEAKPESFPKARK